MFEAGRTEIPLNVCIAVQKRHSSVKTSHVRAMTHCKEASPPVPLFGIFVMCKGKRSKYLEGLDQPLAISIRPGTNSWGPGRLGWSLLPSKEGTVH